MDNKNKSYTMPPASIGLCVWRPSAKSTDQQSPAIITSVGSRSVSLTVWPVDNRGGIPKDGVRHASDPELFENPGNDSGCWDYTPEQIAVHARLSALEETVKNPVRNPKSA